MRRLHWGSGPVTPPGWTHSDSQAWPGVDAVADIRSGLPFADEHFDVVVSIHALPELPYSDQRPALRELARVLRPGGVLRLGLPCLDKAIRAYVSGDVDYFLVRDDEVQDLAGKLVAQLTWFGVSRCFFTASFVSELLLGSGFRETRTANFRETTTGVPGIVDLDDRPLESFFVEAIR